MKQKKALRRLFSLYFQTLLALERVLKRENFGVWPFLAGLTYTHPSINHHLASYRDPKKGKLIMPGLASRSRAALAMATVPNNNEMSTLGRFILSTSSFRLAVLRSSFPSDYRPFITVHLEKIYGDS